MRFEIQAFSSFRHVEFEIYSQLLLGCKADCGAARVALNQNAFIIIPVTFGVLVRLSNTELASILPETVLEE